MKVAILHDYLNQLGGAERVLQVFLEIFPQADLYTLLYDAKKTQYLFHNYRIFTSPLDIKVVRNYHRFFIPLMFFVSKLLKGKTYYDLVISSTAGYSKGFAVKGKYHISYCHSPLRYAWELDYLKNLPLAPHTLSNLIAYPFTKFLRKWDKKQSENVNVFIANSTFTAQKIKSYYQRFSFVLNPPVDTHTFRFTPKPKYKKEEYYLMVGRLLYYKNFDLGIKAFNNLPDKKLKIVGKGPEEKKLKKLVKYKNIEFLGNISDQELCLLYNNAQALIFPQIEDFGLVAAEAQCCGTPVIAYHQGGIKDIVINKKTGLFFFKQEPEEIEKAIHQFEKIKWQRDKIAVYAKRFSKERFIHQFKLILKKCGIQL